MSNTNLPNQPFFFEIIIESSLINFDPRGIGISSNWAKFNSVEGSPSGPFIGISFSAQENKKKIERNLTKNIF